MVYKYIDIVGTSPESIAEAMKDAVNEAAKTVKNLSWAELGRVTLKNRKSRDRGISGGSENWL